MGRCESCRLTNSAIGCNVVSMSYRTMKVPELEAAKLKAFCAAKGLKLSFALAQAITAYIKASK